MSHPYRFIAAAICILLAVRAPAHACGPNFPEALFWFSDRPNEPIDRFLDGHLGIIDQRLDPTYRYVAYRYIAGLGLDTASRTALAPLFTPAPGAGGDELGGDATDRWRDARRTVADPPSDEYVDVFGHLLQKKSVDTDPFGRVLQEKGEETIDLYFRNCLDDAFDTAVATLKRHVAEDGAASPVTIAWAKAQDQVFRTCGGQGEPPPSLGDDGNAAARADRAYQIAAATFYLTRFAEAEQLFRAIAADPESPWRQIAALMIARTLIRKGTLSLPTDSEALRAADGQLAAIESDASLAAVRPSASRLRGYVALQLDPEAARRRLAAALSQPTLDADAAQQLIDYLRLARTLDPRPRDGLALWLRGDPCEGCTGVTPLLEDVAVAGQGSGAPRPGEDAGAARLTLAYFSARSLTDPNGRNRNIAEARAALDRLLSEKARLARGDLNRILALRAPLSTSLDEYLRLSQLVPVGVRQLYVTPAAPDQGVLLSDETLLALDGYFAPPQLARILATRELAPTLARRVAIFAWMKANLLGDETIAESLLPYLRELAPEMTADLDAWSQAKGLARRFAFALTSLRFPGAQPFPGSAFGRSAPLAEIDNFGDNWWCDAVASDSTFSERNASLDTVAPPEILTADDLAAATRMREQLAVVEPAPQYLGAIVLEWARAHSDDPRVPEALHRIVKATRYTHCTNDNGETSEGAFKLLHRRYPDSPWTKQTPFWYAR